MFIASCYPIENPHLLRNSEVTKSKPTQPVVIDTDIGSFIDDHFAITFALQSKANLDIKLIVTCTDDTTARARVLAQLLTILGRDDIPIGIGIKDDIKTNHSLFDWAQHFNLSTYKGGVFEDGVKKMAEVITNTKSTVDIIAIGPMTNFPTLLKNYPGVIKKARIRAMAGSIVRGYNNSVTPSAEYNIRLCPFCTNQTLRAGWNVKLAPLDTTDSASLTPFLLQTFISGMNDASFALSSALLYYCSSKTADPCTLTVKTSSFHDTVAVLLTLPIANQFVETTVLNITISSDGYSRLDNNTGVPTTVALNWQPGIGLDQFKKFLTNVLTGRLYK